MIYSSELYHHGIKGQRWGVRRYQPYPKGYSGDGTFTDKQRSKNFKIVRKSGFKNKKIARVVDDFNSKSTSYQTNKETTKQINDRRLELGKKASETAKKLNNTNDAYNYGRLAINIQADLMANDKKLKKLIEKKNKSYDEYQKEGEKFLKDFMNVFDGADLASLMKYSNIKKY